MDMEQLQEHVKSGDRLEGISMPMRAVAPRIECADGFSLSVQASTTHYCVPRDLTGPYTAFEVGFPSVEVPDFMEYAEDPNDPTGTVYGQVPADLVLEVINAHGGVTHD